MMLHVQRVFDLLAYIVHSVIIRQRGWITQMGRDSAKTPFGRFLAQMRDFANHY